MAGAHAAGHPKPLTMAQAEARNEIPAPNFTGQLYEARWVSSFLTDALVLNNAQQHAVLCRHQTDTLLPLDSSELTLR